MTRILKNQAELQQALSKNFGYKTKPLEMPLYSKMIENKDSEPTKVNLKEITNKFGLLS